MSNSQLYISVGVPFFTLLIVYIASAISNRSTVDSLRAEMRAGFESLGKRLDGLDARLDRMDTRMDRIELRLDRMDGKLDRIAEDVYKLHESRISRLEERVFSREV